MAFEFPAPRIAYDRDGSTAVHLDEDGLSQKELTQSEKESINDESSSFFNLSSGVSGVGWVAIVFTQPMDIKGVFLSRGGTGSTRGPQYSTDTTNGEDGTWIGFSNSDHPNMGSWQQEINDQDLPGVKGIRFGSTISTNNRSELRAIHAYGTPTSEPSDGLWLWDATTDTLLDLDVTNLGGIERESERTIAFRVHNYDSELVSSVEVSADALTIPDYATYFEFSDDAGSTWASPLNIGDLAAGATSGEILARVTIPENADLTQWTARITAYEAQA